MPLNVFDPAKHHLGLREAGVGSFLGFMLDGRYERSTVREQPAEDAFGGRRNLAAPVPGRGSWTQDDFSGGVFQREWGEDDAMVAHSLGMMPAIQERSLITIPPFIPKELFNVEAQPNSETPTYPVRFFSVGSTLYVPFQHGCLRNVIGVSIGWHDLSVIDGGGIRTRIRDLHYDPGEGKLWLLVDKDGASSFLLRRNLDFVVPGGTNRHIAPTTAVMRGRGFELLGETFVICMGQTLWTFRPPDDQDQGGAIVQGVQDTKVYGTAAVEQTTSEWRRLGRLPGQWKDSLVYNGLAHILCVTGGFVTHLVATDGTDILPVCTFPYNFVGSAVLQYGGRIFVLGSGLDINNNFRYGEVYEVSGSSVRLVRSWSPDSYVAGEIPPVFINGGTVAAGLLWFSDSRDHLVIYDLTTDSFYEGSELQMPGGVGGLTLDQLH